LPPATKEEEGTTRKGFGKGTLGKKKHEDSQSRKAKGDRDGSYFWEKMKDVGWHGGEN